jgi:hypothetical protein
MFNDHIFIYILSPSIIYSTGISKHVHRNVRTACNPPPPCSQISPVYISPRPHHFCLCYKMIGELRSCLSYLPRRGLYPTFFGVQNSLSFYACTEKYICTVAFGIFIKHKNTSAKIDAESLNNVEKALIEYIYRLPEFGQSPSIVKLRTSSRNTRSML